MAANGERFLLTGNFIIIIYFMSTTLSNVQSLLRKKMNVIVGFIKNVSQLG